MSILTGVVIVVTMATLAQRSEDLASFFFDEKPPTIAPQNDEAIVVAGAPQVIDVLANDQNVSPEDPDNLNIVVSPSCGAAETTAEGVLYLSNNRCLGQQLFAYCVKRGDECVPASVAVTVMAANETPADGEARPADGLVASAPDAIEVAPAQQIARQPAAPVRPNTAEAIEETDESLVIAALPQTNRLTVPAQSIAPSLPADQEEVKAPEPVSPILSDDEPTIADIASLTPTADVAALTSPVAPDSWFTATAAAPEARTAPALSAMEVAPDTMVLAAAPTPEAPSRSRAQTEEAEQAVTRRQRPGAASGESSAQVGGGECAEPIARTAQSSGGFSTVSISAACLPGEVVSIQHAGLAFSARLNDAGEAEIDIPIFEFAETTTVVLPDGEELSVPLIYNEADLEQIHRVAVSWSAPVNLDLHAFEYAAPFGAEGHVWENNPKEFSSVRRPGGGYLMAYPAAAEGFASVEVYTFWAARRARSGFMRIALDHASRGDVPAGDFCGRGALATPAYSVVRSSVGEVTKRTSGQFAPAPCGQALGPYVRYANSALKDLKIAGR